MTKMEKGSPPTPTPTMRIDDDVAAILQAHRRLYGKPIRRGVAELFVLFMRSATGIEQDGVLGAALLNHPGTKKNEID